LHFFLTACGLRAEKPHKEEDDSSYDLLGDYKLTEHLEEVLDELELKIKGDLEGSVST
jgi:UTP-glucose-1-phosphate uridylyltransferase